MALRILGLETEYGCLVEEPLTPAHIIPEIRNWFFENHRYGMIDVHDREWDEPAGNGGFLFNGGRIYVDMGHIEYCTPECTRATDIVRYDFAGDRLLMRAVEDLGVAGEVQFFRNNIDHYTAATFGCHENYSLYRYAPFTDVNVMSLLTFQTVRVLMTGSGRVIGEQTGNYQGPYLLAESNASPFQISQRADYIQNEFFEWVQHNRAIINTRDEPLADPTRYRRLHLLHGDTNVLPATLFLKVGTAKLVLDLFEDNAMPRIILSDAVATLRSLSSHPDGPWIVRVLEENGARQKMDALEILDTYRNACAVEYAGRDAETDQILALWKTVIDGLAGDRESLVGLVDWITKYTLLNSFRESENLDWKDPWLKSQDMEFHHVDPQRSLGLALATIEPPWDPYVDSAIDIPPDDTRAFVRGDLMRRILENDLLYYVDWDRVEIPNQWRRRMDDPFDATLSGDDFPYRP